MKIATIIKNSQKPCTMLDIVHGFLLFVFTIFLFYERFIDSAHLVTAYFTCS